jgi:hypothetical protein
MIYQKKDLLFCLAVKEYHERDNPQEWNRRRQIIRDNDRIRDEQEQQRIRDEGDRQYQNHVTIDTTPPLQQLSREIFALFN